MAEISIPTLRRAGAAGVDEVPFDPAEWEHLIQSVDRARAVERQPNGSWAADWKTLASVAAPDLQRVKDALYVANSNPVSRQPMATAASAADIAKNIGDVGNLLKKGPNIVGHVITLVDPANTSVKRNWWGLKIDMNHDSATAIATIAAGDVTSILGAVTVFIPAAGPVTLVVGAIGSALGGWVTAVDKGKGIVLKLYGYAIPWVDGVP